MNYELRYEELRKQWPDCLLKSWDELLSNQQVFWIRHFADKDNDKRALSRAKEIIGHLVMDNPQLLPVLEV